MRRFPSILVLAGFAAALAVLTPPSVVRAADEEAVGERADGHGHDPAESVDHAAGDHAAADHHDDGHGGVDYNKPPLNPEIPLLIWSLVVFVGFLLLAKRIAWTPLIHGLNAREARVNRALADAEAARIEAHKLLADHQKHLDSVTEEVKGIIAKARTEAEQEKARIIAEADVETTAMRDAAIAAILAAREQALAEMDSQIDRQVSMAAQHILG